MTKEQNGNFIKCDFCSAGAVANFQKVWMKFTVNNGKYREDKKFFGGDIEEPIEWDNIHACKEHSGKWLNGEI